jgi:hypothetical protein
MQEKVEIGEVTMRFRESPARDEGDRPPYVPTH